MYNRYINPVFLVLSTIVCLLEFPTALAQDATNIYDLYNKGAAKIIMEIIPKL